MLNARPTNIADARTQRSRPSSTPRSSAPAAATRSRVNSASGLLYRNISTAAGLRAVTNAAMVAAAGPNVRLTMLYTRPTVAIPASAWGSRMLHSERPSSRTDSPISIVESGGLSTVMKFAASSEPKNHAAHLWLAACAAIE